MHAAYITQLSQARDRDPSVRMQFVRRIGNRRAFEFDVSTMNTEEEQRGRPSAKLS